MQTSLLKATLQRCATRRDITILANNQNGFTPQYSTLWYTLYMTVAFSSGTHGCRTLVVSRQDLHSDTLCCKQHYIRNLDCHGSEWEGYHLLGCMAIYMATHKTQAWMNKDNDAPPQTS